MNLTLQDAYRAHADGRITEEQLAHLESQLRLQEPRRASQETARRPPVRRFAPRRYRCSPDRRASQQRRRTLGSQFPAPPQIRAEFTQGEAAVLAIIAGEVRVHGRCDLPYDTIAAKAGTCRTTAQNACREAKRLGLIQIQLRPLKGRKSDTNVVTIVSPEWLAWLKRGGIGFKTPLRPIVVSKILHPTKNHIFSLASFERVEPPERGIQESDRDVA